MAGESNVRLKLRVANAAHSRFAEMGLAKAERADLREVRERRVDWPARAPYASQTRPLFATRMETRLRRSAMEEDAARAGNMTGYQ